ncbi:hypothetical protein NQ317_003799 [Molorchus minor]|uniref:Uncharacterized protein n=1 Tax=Molorchus minor TaxID=1323400 RepID=A0ABQ9ISH8_9CUCU|nr:hypothetical protein NQ317_003799 [Molorchus minor]
MQQRDPELVRTYDYENFICTLLLKNSARSCAFAVRGFNVEVARIAEQVSQEATGLMRLQFWEDTVKACYLHDLRAVPKHPVAMELFKDLESMDDRQIDGILAEIPQIQNPWQMTFIRDEDEVGLKL